MTKKTKINKNKKREVIEDEGSNLVNNKKRKVFGNKKNVKTDEVNNNKINEEIDKLANGANKEHDNLQEPIENDKKQTEMEINSEDNNVNNKVKDKNKKEEKINKEGEDKKENKNKEENKKAKLIPDIEEKQSNNKNDNDNANKTNNKNNNSKKEEVSNKSDTSKTKPLRKSKRLLDKQIEIISISTSKKEDTKKVPTTTTKKKRMNADQDLITHQTLENAENLGSKNPLEIIKKVIGNSEEDVELVVGAQLPVLVQPDINRMRYELGEIIAIKTKSEIIKENGEIKSFEVDDKKKSKKIKGKKGKTTKEDGDKKNLDQEIENTNNKNENNENNMKIDDKDIEMSEANQENENEESIVKKNDNEEEKMYYIHFINQDKRLDNWRREEDLWTNKKYPEISNDASETTGK